MMRLPGIAPIEMGDWLIRDEVYAPQMALADELIATRRADVAQLDGIEAQAEELLALVLARLGAGYEIGTGSVRRPDGVKVELTGDHPAIVARRLVQEDFLFHDTRGAAHHLCGGVMCFPASWSLSEKVGRDLLRVHDPVDEYDANLAARVQRLFDGIKPDRPLMRANWNLYRDADLFHPRTEAARRDKGNPRFMRVERQCLVRLPKTGAVVFSIHTYVVPLAALSAHARAALPQPVRG